MTVQERVDNIIAKGSTRQRKLESLWFVFGNHGAAHTMPNHKYVQRYVEGRGEDASLYPATAECKKAVVRAMKVPE